MQEHTCACVPLVMDDHHASPAETASEPQIPPRRRNAPLGMNAMYERFPRRETAFDTSIIHRHNTRMFFTMSGYIFHQFMHLFSLSKPLLDQPINPRMQFDTDPSALQQSHKQALSSFQMLFWFTHLLCSGDEESLALQTAALLYGIRTGTVSNYVNKVTCALSTCLKNDDCSRIKWMDAAPRLSMRDLVFAFPNGVPFVDDTKQMIGRPTNPQTQEER